jgi:hypothetical protein
MYFVIPRPDAGQVNLGALPAALPILDALINLSLDLKVNQALYIGELDTTLLGTVNLLPQILVALLGVSLSGINPLLGDGGKSAPPEIIGKDPLCLDIDATPDGLQLFF